METNERRSAFKASLSKSGGLWLLALSLALSIFLRVPLLFQHPFTFVDEAWFASTSKVLVEGGNLYQDVWCNNQPLPLFFGELLFQVFGLHMDAIHLGSLFLVFLVSALLFCIGSSFFSPAVGGGAALTYALLSTTYYTPRIIGTTTEALMVVFTCAAIYCFLQGRVNARVYGFFGAGLLSFLAVISKPAAVTQLVLFFILLLPRRSQPKGLHLKSLALLGAGYLCGLSLLVLYLADAGSLDLWWYQSLISRVEYVSQITLPDFLSKLIRQPFSFGLITSWIWLLSWGGRQGKEKNRTAYWVILSWLVSAFVGVSMGRRFYANYFIQMFPAMSLLAAVGVTHLWQMPRKRLNKIFLYTSGVLFLLPFLWFQARVMVHWYFFVDPQAHSQIQLWGMCVENREVVEASNYIRSRTQSGDSIFVWGPKPELYFLSGRDMATRYPVYDVANNSEPPFDASADLETVEVLRKVRPRYIIDVMRNIQLEDFAPWRNLVEEAYDFQTQMHEMRFYRLRD